MDPRQAPRERREAERKAKKLALKKSRLAEEHSIAAEDERSKEVQIRNHAMAGLAFASVRAGHVRPARPQQPLTTRSEIGFVSQNAPQARPQSTHQEAA